MIHSVSSGSSVSQVPVQDSSSVSRVAASAPSAKAPEDTVQISAKALASAGGDNDHDGDHR